MNTELAKSSSAVNLQVEALSILLDRPAGAPPLDEVSDDDGTNVPIRAPEPRVWPRVWPGL